MKDILYMLDTLKLEPLSQEKVFEKLKSQNHLVNQN